MNKVKKTKTKAKLWEKIFVIASIIAILVLIGKYAYRTVYYYKKLNYIKPESKLIDVLTNDMKIAYFEDGLYKTDDYYYYKGLEVDNYLLYSGRLWRIIMIDKTGIKLITEDNQSSLVWGNNTNYEKSYINKWLNEDVFLKSLEDEEKLAEGSWCNKAIDIGNYECTETINAKVGLLQTNEYIKAGGANSYLNNKTYFWTINTSEDNKAYYVHTEGGINNDVGANNALYSYGIRPVIYLNKDVIYVGGNGTIENPYSIKNDLNVNIGTHPVGSYVKYKDHLYRIFEKSEEYTELIMDGYLLNDKEEPVKVTYNKVFEYLNKDFLNTLNKEDLVELEFPKTEYNLGSGYNYLNKKGTTKAYVGIPTVGSLFTANYSGNWLNTISNSSQNLIYTTNESSILADLGSASNYLRPLIAVKNNLIITSGHGTKEDPYVVGENNET